MADLVITYRNDANYNVSLLFLIRVKFLQESGEERTFERFGSKNIMKYYLQPHCYKSVAMEVLRSLMNCQFTKVSATTDGILRSNFYL